MNILDTIQKATIGKNLSFEESQHAMEQIMSGKMLPSQFGSLMTSLTIKGETAEEIAGMASIMRKYSLKIPNNENAGRRPGSSRPDIRPAAYCENH